MDPRADRNRLIWRMTVRTPKLREFVSLGYTVVAVGSELDGVHGAPDWL
ncbi:hypothetical protein [Streptomyces coeruleorubidus]